MSNKNTVTWATHVVHVLLMRLNMDPDSRMSQDEYAFRNSSWKIQQIKTKTCQEFLVFFGSMPLRHIVVRFQPPQDDPRHPVGMHGAASICRRLALPHRAAGLGRHHGPASQGGAPMAQCGADGVASTNWVETTLWLWLTVRHGISMAHRNR